jgi:hypothetical protein
MSVDEHRFARVVDERCKIVEFALDRVRLSVCALASTSAVEVVDREMPRQGACQRDVEAVVPERAAD